MGEWADTKISGWCWRSVKMGEDLGLKRLKFTTSQSFLKNFLDMLFHLIFTTCLCERDDSLHCVSEPSRGWPACVSLWVGGGSLTIEPVAMLGNQGRGPGSSHQGVLCRRLDSWASAWSSLVWSWTSPWPPLGLNIPIWTEGGWGSMVWVYCSGTLSSVYPLSTLGGWHRARPAFGATEASSERELNTGSSGSSQRWEQGTWRAKPSPQPFFSHSWGKQPTPGAEPSVCWGGAELGRETCLSLTGDQGSS